VKAVSDPYQALYLIDVQVNLDARFRGHDGSDDGIAASGMAKRR
jgi:hypothetical protein